MENKPFSVFKNIENIKKRDNIIKEELKINDYDPENRKIKIMDLEKIIKDLEEKISKDQQFICAEHGNSPIAISRITQLNENKISLKQAENEKNWLSNNKKLSIVN